MPLRLTALLRQRRRQRLDASVEDMIRAHRRLALPLAAALLAGPSGCAAPRRSSPAAPVSTALPTPDPAVDLHDAGRVCDAFATAVYRLDTRIDRGPHDAYRRAAAYLDLPLAAAVIAELPGPGGPGWRQWTAHDVSTTVEVTAYAGDALPTDTAAVRHEAAVVTVTPIGRGGWRGPTDRHTVLCALRSSDHGWRVTAYEIN